MNAVALSQLLWAVISSLRWDLATERDRLMTKLMKMSGTLENKYMLDFFSICVLVIVMWFFFRKKCVFSKHPFSELHLKLFFTQLLFFCNLTCIYVD